MNFYKNVVEHRGKLLIRGIHDGQDYKEKIDFGPTLYSLTQEHSQYKTLDGKNLKPIEFSDIRAARQFRKDFSTPNSPVYGLERYHYQYINNEHPEKIEWDKDLIKIYTVDIETTCEGGFPNVEDPQEELLCITVKNQSNKQILTWGVGDFVTDRLDVTYVKCKHEKELMFEFMKFWMKNYPDVITGWNTKFFDVPYLMARITEVAGPKIADKMSPWSLVNKGEVVTHGRPQTTYELVGIANLDYLDLYKWFIPQRQESYKLDHIGFVELGRGKDDMGFETFKDWYTKDFQSFIDYNIQDVEIVDALEDKLGLIQLGLTVAYESKVNFQDIYSQVRVWDTLIANHLLTKGICIPPREDSVKNEKYEGAFVKDPIQGQHKWIVSFDINSLYPHIIIQYNISPEKLLGTNGGAVSVNRMLAGETIEGVPEGACITPNGAMFKTDAQGFLPEMMETMYNERVIFKKRMLKAKAEYQKTKDPELVKEIARCHNIQWARKIALNSAYGAVGNQYFRFYDVRQAAAITTAGQFIIRFIEEKVNTYMNTILKLKDEDKQDYIVASDTDSIYVTLDKLVEKTCQGKDNDQICNFIDKVVNSRLEPFIEKCFDELSDYTNAFKNCMVMKREVIANKGIWVAKKRYMLNVLDDEGVRLSEPKLKIMGIEAVKSSTPQVCRGKIKEAIKIIMNKDEDTLQKFIAEFKTEFNSLSAEAISFPRSCNNIKKYRNPATIFSKGTPIHVKGSLIYNQKLRELKLHKQYPFIKEGDKIKFLKLKEANPFRFDVISYITTLPVEFKLQEYIDYETQFEKTFLDPMRFILQAIGWSQEKKASLDAFFS